MKSTDTTFLELIPESLKTAEFLNAWSEWVDERKTRRNRLTPRAAKLQLVRCAAWGPRKSVDSILQSIERGWTGLFEPHEQSGARPLSVWEYQTIIDSKQQSADRIRNMNSTETGLSRTWNSEPKRQQYLQMIGEIKTLKSKMESLGL